MKKLVTSENDSFFGQGFDSLDVHHMFHIYLIFNIKNGKVYVGKTNNLHKRWTTHKRTAKIGKTNDNRFSIIHKAISKYGEDNFQFLRLQSFEKEDEAYLAEVYWISFYNSRNSKFGYNAAPGGIGSGSGTNSANFGLKRTPETIAKLVDSHLGEKNQNYGKTFSDETIQRMRISQKGKQLGENNAHSILTWDDVNRIRFLYKNGLGATEIAKMFNTHRTNIYHIVKYKTWIK